MRSLPHTWYCTMLWKMSMTSLKNSDILVDSVRTVGVSTPLNLLVHQTKSMVNLCVIKSVVRGHAGASSLP